MNDFVHKCDILDRGANKGAFKEDVHVHNLLFLILKLVFLWNGSLFIWWKLVCSFIKTSLISFQNSIDNILWHCVSWGQMECNILSQMNLYSQTKDLNFFLIKLLFNLIWSCNKVLLHISLPSCFSSDHVLEQTALYTSPCLKCLCCAYHFLLPVFLHIDQQSVFCWACRNTLVCWLSSKSKHIGHSSVH